MTTDLKNKSFSILIVDDERNNIQLLGNVLREEGYEPEFATNGVEALEWVNRQHFDLVLLDVVMPDIDGYEVCKRLKSNPATANTPVIFLTVKDDADSIANGFEAGSVDYVIKPFNTTELLARVKTHLALRQFGRELESKNSELELKNSELTQALEEIKTLQGIIPICANCKKIRDDRGAWEQIENYIQNHSDAQFSHSVCPECVEELYGHHSWYNKLKNSDNVIPLDSDHEKPTLSDKGIADKEK